MPESILKPRYTNDSLCVKYGKAFQRGGTQYINDLIREGIENHSRTATITGNWDIEAHICVPSDFTLIFDGCFLKMADATFDNMFVNEHHGTDLGKTLAGADRNIRMLGKNGAILDGGTFNGLTERTTKQSGMPPMRKNILLYFTNVDGFEVTGLTLQNNRWWAMNFCYCRNGHLWDLEIQADDTCIDEAGNVYHGLSVARYYDIYIKQTDGINIRRGCQNILVEDIRGLSGDDLVALTCLDSKGDVACKVEGVPDDLCNITVRNVRGAAIASCVRLLCQGVGSSLHDILVENIVDNSDREPRMSGCANQLIRVGEGTLYYGSGEPGDEKFYNITIRNVRSRADFALYLGGKPIEHLVYEKIETFDGGGYITERWVDDPTKLRRPYTQPGLKK